MLFRSGAIDEGLKRGEAFDGLRVFEQVLYAARAGEAEGETQRLAGWRGEVRGGGEVGECGVQDEISKRIWLIDCYDRLSSLFLYASVSWSRFRVRGCFLHCSRNSNNLVFTLET